MTQIVLYLSSFYPFWNSIFVCFVMPNVLSITLIGILLNNEICRFLIPSLGENQTLTCWLSVNKFWYKNIGWYISVYCWYINNMTLIHKPSLFLNGWYINISQILYFYYIVNANIDQWNYGLFVTNTSYYFFGNRKKCTTHQPETHNQPPLGRSSLLPPFYGFMYQLLQYLRNATSDQSKHGLFMTSRPTSYYFFGNLKNARSVRRPPFYGLRYQLIHEQLSVRGIDIRYA